MIETLVISTIILALCMVLLAVKVLFKRGGTFASQHIHDSKAMRERGINCVIDQDREVRQKAEARKH